MADWEYISECSEAAAPLPVFGCGDVLSYEDHELHSSQAGIMIARCVCVCVCVCVCPLFVSVCGHICAVSVVLRMYQNVCVIVSEVH